MSAAREIERAVTPPSVAVLPPPTPDRVDAPALARRIALRLKNEWLPRAVWTISRTGRPGLVGIALLLASALFLFSTHLQIAAEVEALRKDLAAAQTQARTGAADKGADSATAARALPARSDMPAILRQLFGKVGQAGLVVDAGKYEINATGSGGVVRYQIAFPVTGPYPQVRTLIDATLAAMPSVALSELVLDRKSIGDAAIDAQIRLTVYTAAHGAIRMPGAGSETAMPVLQASAGAATEVEPARARVQARAAKVRPASDRIVPPVQALALFAPHSWYVPPPPPPPVAPPPPPAPTAPPFPYTFIGSYAPDGHPPVFFLSQGDHVIDARVGDRLDGVYQFESASGGQLVFVYLPLNVRQTLASGVTQ